MSSAVQVVLPPPSAFRLDFTPLPPLPGERPDEPPAERKRPRTPSPPPRRVEDALMESLFDDGPPAPRRSPFASWRGNHAGLLSEYGGVRRFMQLERSAKVETP